MTAEQFTQRCQWYAERWRPWLPEPRVREILGKFAEAYADFDLPDPVESPNGFVPTEPVQYYLGEGFGPQIEWRPGRLLARVFFNGQEWYIVLRADGAYVRVQCDHLSTPDR